MRKSICALVVLALIGCMAVAETSIIEQPQIIIEMITPSPSPEPVGETFSSEDLIVTLPAGMTILTPEERTGYDAAVNFDFPSAGNAILLASDMQTGAALSFSILESNQEAAAAASEAALSIPEAGNVEEITLGENRFSSFRCTFGIDEVQIFFLSDGARLLCVGSSGLEDEAIHAMLTGLIF